MKANRAAGGRDDEAAVSSVVSAVLLFALFTTASVMWTFQTLPEWIADREEAHQGGVVERFATLRSGLETLSAGDDPGTVAITLPLSPRPVALLQTAPAQGELGLEDDLEVSATFTGTAIHLLDGAPLGLPSEAVDGNVLADVAGLTALVLSLASSGVNNNDIAWVQASATDGTETATIRVTHAGRNQAVDCADKELRITVTTSAGTTDHVLTCGVGSALGGRAVDALDGVYGFRAALRRLDAPYSVTLTDGGTGTAAGTFTAVWSDSNGLVQVAGSGQSSSFSVSQSGARLAHTGRYQHHPAQSLSWEGGAFVREQPDGEAVHTDPTFSLLLDGTTGHLAWTMIALQGTGSISGTGTATATVRHTTTTEVVLTATGGTFTVDGPHGGAWRAFFTDKALLSGVTPVTVGGTGDVATLTLATDASVTSWTIHLRLIEAEVSVD